MVAREKKRCFDKCLQPLANKSVKSYELCVVVCSRYCVCCIQIIALGKAMNQESFFLCIQIVLITKRNIFIVEKNGEKLFGNYCVQNFSVSNANMFQFKFWWQLTEKVLLRSTKSSYLDFIWMYSIWRTVGRSVLNGNLHTSGVYYMHFKECIEWMHFQILNIPHVRINISRCGNFMAGPVPPTEICCKTAIWYGIRTSNGK